MSDFLFENNVVDSLALNATSGALTITVINGAQFPSPGMYEQFAVRVRDTSSGDHEIMYCVGRTGNVLTVDRAQEGTVAIPFDAGAEVTMPITAGVLEYLRDL